MPLNGAGWEYRWLKWQAMGWLLLGRDEAARSVLDTMLRRWPGDEYALASRAHVLAQRGHRAEAIADMQALVSAQPDCGAAQWFNLAFLLEEVGRLEEAEAAFRRALALQPKLDRAWYGLGLTLIRLRRPEEALAAFKMNTELQPMSPYGWYQLARLQFERREPEEARRIIRHLKRFEPRVAEQLERETGLVA